MTDTVKEAPINSPQEVQAMAGGLSALVQNGNELSSSAQVLRFKHRPAHDM